MAVSDTDLSPNRMAVSDTDLSPNRMAVSDTDLSLDVRGNDKEATVEADEGQEKEENKKKKLKEKDDNNDNNSEYDACDTDRRNTQSLRRTNCQSQQTNSSYIFTVLV